MPNAILGGSTSTTIKKIPLGEKVTIRFQPELSAELPQSAVNAALGQVYLQLSKKGAVIGNLIAKDFQTTEGELFFTLDSNSADLGATTGDIIKSSIVISNNGIDVESALGIFDTFQIITTRTGGDQELDIYNTLQHIPASLESLNNINVALTPTDRQETPDVILWRVIRDSTNAISFDNYQSFINTICEGNVSGISAATRNQFISLGARRSTPFIGADNYQTLKTLTEAFLLLHCGVALEQYDPFDSYLEEVKDGFDTVDTLPYLAEIKKRLQVPLKNQSLSQIFEELINSQTITPDDNCFGILTAKFTNPCFLELIWSYWHEEAMLVQALSVISRRFQNMRGSNGKDPLAGLETDPLRPLNNFLWGYIQDEQHRLSVKRRAYEYDHHYGISLIGKAVSNFRPADSRSKFIEAFHALLHLCTKFFRQEDDKTVQADPYPILNALREVHLIISEGAHNQYGDLPFTARAEMLMQQWLLARPEMREFIPTRAMVAYPEAWMGTLGSLNNMMGWTNVVPLHYHLLAVYGERLLLSIRFGHWSDESAITLNQPANWANTFRKEIQGYIHAYRAVTGVDLSEKIDARQPSLYLKERLLKKSA
jgi:hypothetical protein